MRESTKFTLFFALLLVASIGLLVAPFAIAQPRTNPEAFYVQRWCDRFAGETEVVLEDRTRVDCETYFHAIEFDFADKWAEAIGQALHYAILTGKRAGIVLIIEDPADMRHVERVYQIVSTYSLPVEIWVTGPGEDFGDEADQ